MRSRLANKVTPFTVDFGQGNHYWQTYEIGTSNQSTFIFSGQDTDDGEAPIAVIIIPATRFLEARAT